MEKINQFPRETLPLSLNLFFHLAIWQQRLYLLKSRHKFNVAWIFQDKLNGSCNSMTASVLFHTISFITISIFSISYNISSDHFFATLYYKYKSKFSNWYHDVNTLVSLDTKVCHKCNQYLS